jgi:uncharacterized protein (TIGR03437 family)
MSFSSARRVGLFIVCLHIAIPGFGQYVRNRYALILEDPPVAQRYVGREAMRTTAAAGYRQQIQSKQTSLQAELRRRNVTVIDSVSEVLNAIFVSVTPDRLAELEALPGVLGSRPMRQMKMALNKATQLMNAPAAWTQLGGVNNAGKGIKIGILDTGIDQNHPAFQDSSLSAPSGFPKCSGSADACSYTNGKVIVARSYVSQIVAGNLVDPSNPAASSIPDDFSPRDRVGHGTAVASVAAGNTNSGSVTFNGMAPKAWVGNYKIWGSPSVNDNPPEDVWISAINDALKDGMDIVNMSSGGVATTAPLDTGAACGAAAGVPCDPVATAFENAAKTMVIVVAGGNAGSDGDKYPAFATVSSPGTAPSVISVGATTNSHGFAPAVRVLGAGVPAALQNIAALPSDSFFYPSLFGAAGAPLIDVSTVGDGYACKALPAGSLNNAFALVQRGPTGSGACTFDVKAANAQDAGAAGMILFMSADSPPLTPPYAVETVDQFVGPVVGISNADGVALKAWLAAHPAAQTVIDLAGAEVNVDTYSQSVNLSPPLTSNQLATYSSFGPSIGDGAIKPEMVAVGGLDNVCPDVNDCPFNGSMGFLYPYSGIYMAAQTYDPLGELYSANGYLAADGTSFSSPIVAGAAALVKQAHPTYSVAQIKSALVNTTARDVTVDTSNTTVDVAWLGAGRLDAGAAAATNVTLQVIDVPAPAAPPAVTTLNFGILKTGTTLPISKTIQVTNSGGASVTLNVAAVTSVAAAGTTIAVDKTSLTVAANATGTVTVTLSGSVPKAGQYSGSVNLSGSGVTLHVPYLFLVGAGVATNDVFLFGGVDGIVNQSSGDMALRLTDQYGVAVAGGSVTFTAAPRGTVTLSSVAGAPACTPASSAASITCPTDNYGVAWAGITLGASATTNAGVTVRTSCCSTFTVSGTVRNQPTISSGGVVDGASFKTPIAPGSYISIFGSNLSDFTDSAPGLSDINGAPLALPMSLDGVTVSFDVPSAKVSAPGRLVFVSPGQINLQVPWELQGQTSAQVKVVINEDSFGNVVTVPLADAAPGIIENSGIAAALDSNFKVVTTANPVKRGQAVQLYVNGLGPVTPQPVSGESAVASPLSKTNTTPVVTIGGQPAQVLFSGLAPGFPGLYQVNVTVPAGISAGTAPITVAIGSATSKASGLPVN